MYWVTARRVMDFQIDHGWISQGWFGACLAFPRVSNNRLIRLDVGYDHVADFALPEPVTDVANIEESLARAGIPLTGWCPGRDFPFSKYNERTILYSLLQMVRLLARDSENGTVTVKALREKFVVDDRLFLIHLLNLIEDAAGVVLVSHSSAPLRQASLRLANWHETMDVSTNLIEQIRPQFPGDVIHPEIHLRLDDSYTGDTWVITELRTNTYSISSKGEPYIQSTGNKSFVDHILTEWMVPLGWSATTGQNVTRLQAQLEQGKKEKI